MKKSSVISLLLIASLMLSLCLCACSSNNASTATEAATEATSAAETTMDLEYLLKTYVMKDVEKDYGTDDPDVMDEIVLDELDGGNIIFTVTYQGKVTKYLVNGVTGDILSKDVSDQTEAPTIATESPDAQDQYDKAVDAVFDKGEYGSTPQNIQVGEESPGKVKVEYDSDGKHYIYIYDAQSGELTAK